MQEACFEAQARQRAHGDKEIPPSDLTFINVCLLFNSDDVGVGVWTSSDNGMGHGCRSVGHDDDESVEYSRRGSLPCFEIAG